MRSSPDIKIIATLNFENKGMLLQALFNEHSSLLSAKILGILIAHFRSCITKVLCRHMSKREII